MVIDDLTSKNKNDTGMFQVLNTIINELYSFKIYFIKYYSKIFKSFALKVNFPLFHKVVKTVYKIFII